MITKKAPKNATQYICNICNFECSKKSDYNRHLNTAKHKMITNGNILYAKKRHYICGLCDKEFKYPSGLSRHMKICKDQNTNKLFDINNNDDLQQDDTNSLIESGMFMNLLKQNQDFKQLIIEQQCENKQIKELMIEQQHENQKLQSKLIEAVKDSGNIINSHVTNNTNQQFNLNFFLNTTCKDAMNMSEFIKNIDINFKDIENIGKNGYVNGMTEMILSRIKELDITKRPLHCTDLKRETMYIKDNDEWSKDTPENSKLHKMINFVAKRNYATIPLWRETYPECQNWNDPKYEFCVDMMRNILGDIGEKQIKLDNKVIKNISKHIVIDKK
jgi:chemotaxis protein CheY-P-specific phosphatase CheC